MADKIILMQNILQNEIEDLIKTKWKFLNNNYSINCSVKYHRTELKHVNKINDIKINIKNNLGFTGPFAFITDFCSHISLPGPYNNIDKILLCIQYLLNGYSIDDMEEFIKPSSFYKIYSKIFIKNREELDIWIDKMNENYFSNKDIRILTSQLKNPPLLKNVTMMLDGHHNRICYANINVRNKELYSWKLKKPGLNTQFVIDNNLMCIYISKSLPCKDNNDDRMFINDIKLKNFMSVTDILAFDGLYENTVNEVVEKYSSNGFDIKVENFLYPVRKQRNIDLNPDELIFNNQFASYRSIIESYFAELGSTFHRFNAKKNIRITDKDVYNTQLKLACLFLNFKKMEILSNIKLTDIHKAWFYVQGIDFIPKEQIIPSTPIVTFKLNNIVEMNTFQMDALNKIIFDYQNKDYSENTVDMDIGENSESSKTNEKDDFYVVDYIIKDRTNKGIREFYVKWKGYQKKDNSWVKENDFGDRSLIEKYLETK